MEILAKNLWLLITIVLPGMFTYGILRLFFLLSPSTVLDANAFNDVDSSALLTSCVIVAIAVLQQSIGLLIEFVFYAMVRKKNKATDMKKLFYERFTLKPKNDSDNSTTNVVGNFFLSLNVFIGILMLLIYFLFFEDLSFSHWIPLLLLFFMLVLVFNLIFRYRTAIQVIKTL